MSEFDLSAVDLSGILNKNAEEKAKQLPDPKTFHVLCVVPEAMEEYANSEVGLIKAGQSMHYEEVLTSVLFVVKLGPDCYKDPTRFPSGLDAPQLWPLPRNPHCRRRNGGHCCFLHSDPSGNGHECSLCKPHSPEC